MLNIVIFGPPGAGKGTQSSKLIDKYNLHHISTGDLFRMHIKENTALGQKVKSFTDNGVLVPDSVTIEMLEGELNEHKANVDGFIFDGFPRTVAQAEALDQFMKDNDTKIHAIVALDVNEEEVRARIEKRKLVEKRKDDEEEKVNRRINEYFSKTVHVLPFYKQQDRLNTINGVGNPEEIFASIVEVVDQHVQ